MTEVQIDGEWFRPVHYCPKRMVYTMERSRRFFKGRYRVVTAQEIACRWRGGRAARVLH